jgi:hypothetical protein
MKITVKRCVLITFVTISFVCFADCGSDVQIIGDDLEGDHVCKEVEK